MGISGEPLFSAHKTIFVDMVLHYALIGTVASVAAIATNQKSGNFLVIRWNNMASILMQRRSDVAKVLFRNGLQISNDEDRNQLMAVSLLLMSRNCTAMGDYQDVVKVARTALDLAEKIPDHGLQCAALHILSGRFFDCVMVVWW